MLAFRNLEIQAVKPPGYPPIVFSEMSMLFVVISCVTSLIKKLFYDHWPFGIFLCKFNGFFKYANMFSRRGWRARTE